MYVCVHVCIYVHVGGMHMCVCSLPKVIYTCVSVYIYLYMYVYAYMCVHVQSVYMHMCVYVWVPACMYVGVSYVCWCCRGQEKASGSLELEL